MILSIFKCVYLPSVHALVKCPLTSFAYFLSDCFLCVKFWEFFTYSGTHVLCKIPALQRFSPRLWLISPSLVDQKFLILRFNLSICSFMDYAFGIVSKKYLLILGSKIFPLLIYLLPEIFLFFTVYLFLRQSQSTSRGRAEREGDTELEADSRVWAVSTEPDVGLELAECEIVTWAKVGRFANWATQVPHEHKVLKFLCLKIFLPFQFSRWVYIELIFLP